MTPLDFGEFVDELIWSVTDDHVFGRAEYALHELCHWLTLGCPPISEDLDVTSAINALSPRKRDLNEMDALAVEWLVLEEHGAFFGVDDPIRVVADGWGQTTRAARLIRKYAWLREMGLIRYNFDWVLGKVKDAAIKRWVRGVSDRREDPFIQDCALSINMLLR